MLETTNVSDMSAVVMCQTFCSSSVFTLSFAAPPAFLLIPLEVLRRHSAIVSHMVTRWRCLVDPTISILKLY